LLVLTVVLVGAGVILGLLYLLPEILGFGGGEECHPKENATCSLDFALPSPWTKAHNFIPLTTFNVEYLNSHREGRRAEIHYVDAHVASDGPGVVSVNPIDDFTWGAAAKSRKTGRCFLILAQHDRADPGLGTTKYGELSQQAPCVGSAAIPEKVTLENWE
jgi:hypothetical protein